MNFKFRNINTGLFLLLVVCASYASLPDAINDRNKTSSSELNGKQELFTFVGCVHAPKAVLDLAQKGYENYRKEPLKSQISSDKWDALGSSRQKDWIKQTFGLTEENIITHFSELPPPPTWKAREIGVAYEDVVAGSKSANLEKPTFYLVQNVGINGLNRTDLGRGAIVQLASQFNYLESPSPELVPVSQYLYDHTQGPQGVIEAAAGTLHRHAAVIAGKLPHALHNVLPTNNSDVYKNGYLELGHLNDATCKSLEKTIKDNISELEILPQWVMCETSGAYQLQVFASAPSFQGSKSPAPGSCAARIAEMIVVKQYELIAKLAVIQSKSYGRIPLHLTLVGQGAFNNPTSIIEKALNAVAKVVKGHKVDVYVHVFKSPDKIDLINNIPKPTFNLVHMSRDDFKSRKQ